MNLSIEPGQTLADSVGLWLPIIVAAVIVWLAARGLKRLFRSVVGLAWVMHWSGVRFPSGF